MKKRLFDRCVMVFVLCLGVLLLFLQLASSPSGRNIPSSVVALSMVGAMVAITVATLRSRTSGWNERPVRLVGALFALMALWLVSDPPPVFRTALLDGGLAVVLLAAGYRPTSGASRGNTQCTEVDTAVIRDP